MSFSFKDKWYTKARFNKKKELHRPGIEPGPPAWQASILPLNQRCLDTNWIFLFLLKLNKCSYFKVIWWHLTNHKIGWLLSRKYFSKWTIRIPDILILKHSKFKFFIHLDSLTIIIKFSYLVSMVIIKSKMSFFFLPKDPLKKFCYSNHVVNFFHSLDFGDLLEPWIFLLQFFVFCFFESKCHQSSFFISWHWIGQNRTN